MLELIVSSENHSKALWRVQSSCFWEVSLSEIVCELGFRDCCGSSYVQCGDWMCLTSSLTFRHCGWYKFRCYPWPWDLRVPSQGLLSLRLFSWVSIAKHILKRCFFSVPFSSEAPPDPTPFRVLIASFLLALSHQRWEVEALTHYRITPNCTLFFASLCDHLTSLLSFSVLWTI